MQFNLHFIQPQDLPRYHAKKEIYRFNLPVELIAQVDYTRQFLRQQVPELATRTHFVEAALRFFLRHIT